MNVSYCDYEGIAGYINTNRYFGPICSSKWSQFEANVYCREQGYKRAEDPKISNKVHSDLKHSNNSITDVKCTTGKEKFIVECVVDTQSKCEADSSIVVKCLSE